MINLIVILAFLICYCSLKSIKHTNIIQSIMSVLLCHLLATLPSWHLRIARYVKTILSFTFKADTPIFQTRVLLILFFILGQYESIDQLIIKFVCRTDSSDPNEHFLLWLR